MVRARNSLSDLAWPEVAERAAAGAVLAIPLGATEQHGHHLPISTDTDIAVALCERLAESEAVDVLVAPPVAFGSSGEHAGFAGTLSIGQTALELLVVELCRSATDTFSRVLLVSAHGGNAESVERAVDRLGREERDVRVYSPFWDAEPHAGRPETSLMLEVSHATVQMHAAVPGDSRPLAEALPVLRTRGVRAVSKTGVLGNPVGANAQEGSDLLATLGRDLITMVRTWTVSDP